MTVYLDHAAATPVRATAREAYLAALDTVGNPSAIHLSGQAARSLLEAARADVAGAVGADPIEVIFTSGGTESINLALRGIFTARRREDSLRRRIVVPAGEHHATLDTVALLSRAEGAEIDEVPLDRQGRIDHDAWTTALSREPETIALATALWVNNELGTRQDVEALSATCAEAGVPLHLDAVAAFGHVPVSLAGPRGDGVGLVALSLSGHKAGGVPGSGALVVHRSVSIDPLIVGGGQERGLRSGTPSVAAAASMGVAARESVTELASEAQRVGALRERLLSGLVAAVPTLRPTVDSTVVAPHFLHVTIPNCTAESLIFLLDREGIAASAGSACQSGVSEPSHVVTAIGLEAEEADSVLRLSLGHTTTEADIDALITALPRVVEQARAVR